jgi:hypothetical protein
MIIALLVLSLVICFGAVFLWRTKVIPRLSAGGPFGVAVGAAPVHDGASTVPVRSEWTALDEVQLIRLLTDSAS